MCTQRFPFSLPSLRRFGFSLSLSLKLRNQRAMEKELPTHPHPLIPCYMSSSRRCGMCFRLSDTSGGFDGFYCVTCINGVFHKECAESPLELHHHPYHPPHSLSLLPHGHHLLQGSELCSCCAEELGGEWAYRCQICDFFIHLRCANRPPALEVAQPRSHDHKLFLLPKPRPFTCDACGLMLDGSFLPWTCLECGAMIHRECIDLPRVIRISRHPQHRLCYVSSPPPSPAREPSWSCGVCRKVVDNRYGAYSCIKDDCHYVVHPKCGTRRDVWDGVDLEGFPEEPEDIEPPFQVIDDKVIRHFSHDHHLKLNEDDGADFDGSKHCGICALSIRIHLGNIYSCMKRDCDVALHEKCANLPRKIWCMLHPHRLELQIIDMAGCDVCIRLCCGYIYSCSKEGCGFKVDVNCASVSEPLTHITHPHPLFSMSISMRGDACSGCKDEDKPHKMQCTECDFNLCFKCITLPPKVRYKQDRHPLVLGGGGGGEEVASWWCEICEEEMEPDKEMYYTCDSCCVTVHVRCILGEEPYVKTGRYSTSCEEDYEVVANVRCCRPTCHHCLNRCPFPIAFKRNGLYFCTSHYLWAFVQ
ncbi:PREDICTED: uncharacterized protein LOC104803116 [Tarenaya hassleriana]|uniref:uncharacterized protein LOC104803116 n=1 Tax=Tarenaya hassleriana TaxID=28532 RepID=UPI0008FCF5FE|nr:PREDICTED: uncharacterized protein LOC104803116 [Tarenaya hassleriana]